MRDDGWVVRQPVTTIESVAALENDLLCRHESICPSIRSSIIHSILLDTVRDGDWVCRLTSNETAGVAVYKYDLICRYVSIYPSIRSPYIH